jgi:hypothetical protein
MADELIAHLRTALQLATDAESKRLRTWWDGHDAVHRARVEMLAPAIQSLESLRAETLSTPGLQITIPAHGGTSTIELQSGAAWQNFVLSTSHDNSKFQLEHSYTELHGDNESWERAHKSSDVAELLSIVVEAIGKHIASQQVLEERNRSVV